MNIKLLILANLFLVLSLLYPHKIFAHFPSTDNSMTVEFHIEPYHDPIPGQKSYLRFLYYDESESFDSTKCNCILTISKKGKELFRKQLLGEKDKNTNIWKSFETYIFPEKGIYHLRIIGEPKASNDFQSFDVSWDFRVDPKGSHGLVEKKQSSSIPMLVGFVIGLIIFLAIMGWLIKGIVEADKLDNERKIR